MSLYTASSTQDCSCLVPCRIPAPGSQVFEKYLWSERMSIQLQFCTPQQASAETLCPQGVGAEAGPLGGDPVTRAGAPGGPRSGSHQTPRLPAPPCPQPPEPGEITSCEPARPSRPRHSHADWASQGGRARRPWFRFHSAPHLWALHTQSAEPPELLPRPAHRQDPSQGSCEE